MAVICKLPSGEADKRVYLYKKGNSSGWVATGYHISGQTDATEGTPYAPTLTYAENGMSMALQNTSSGGARVGQVFSENAIDLTNYSKLKIHVVSARIYKTGSAYQSIMFFVSGSKANNYERDAVQNIVAQNGVSGADVSISDQTLELDISTISGNKYVAFYIRSIGSLVVDAVWLEPKEKVKPVNLYKLGDECTSVTGGWKFPQVYGNFNSKFDSYQTMGGVTGSVTRTKNTDNIYLKSYGSAGSCNVASVYTANKIDVSGYSKLKIRATATGGMGARSLLMGTTKEPSNGTGIYDAGHVIWFTVKSETSSNNVYDQILEKDISSVTDSLYITIQAFIYGEGMSASTAVTSECTIYEVWLE